MSRTPIRVALALILAAALPLAAHAAGTGSSSTPPEPAEDPLAVAERHYNRGVKAQEKFWDLEEKLAAASDSERAKLSKRVERELKRAAEAFESAIELNPAHYKAYNGLGYVLRKGGDFESALAAYDKALELNPTYTDAIEYRAEAYLSLNRLDEAKDAYMLLFQQDRPLADQLLDSMQQWVEGQRLEPSVDAGVIDAFESWVSERAEIAEQVASLSLAESGPWK